MTDDDVEDDLVMVMEMMVDDCCSNQHLMIHDDEEEEADDDDDDDELFDLDSLFQLSSIAGVVRKHRPSSPFHTSSCARRRGPPIGSIATVHLLERRLK